MRTACTIGALGLALVAALGCGDDKKSPDPGSGAKGTETTNPTTTPAAAAPPVGIDAVKKLNYVFGDGAEAYKKVTAAYKATPRDWSAIKAAAEATLVLDAGHLDAHRVLANAFAQQSDFASTTKHLLIALAGDWMHWGPSAEADTELAAYWKSPEGEAAKKLLGTMREDAAKLQGGIKLLGRRSTFKWPAKPGVTGAWTRGELYAYDLEGKRFLRLTHTDHELAAWMPSPSGDEIVALGYSKVDMPDSKKSPDAPPTFKRAWVKVYDPTTWEQKGKGAVIESGRAIAVHYAAGDQLVVTTYAPNKRWGLGAATTWSFDRTTGKLAKTKAAAPEGERVVMTFDDVVFEGKVAGVEADWAGDPRSAGSFRLGDNKQPVTLSAGAMALESSFAWSPNKTRAAFATASDPCAKAAEDQKSAIYVVDVATGKLKHLLTAQSRFGARWIDEDRVVYEDDAGALRVYDAAQGKEIASIKEKAGMALRGFAASPKTLCKATFVPEIAPVEPGGDEDRPADPVEEPAPATTP